MAQRHSSVSDNAHRRGVIIGAAIGSVAGAALLGFGVYQLLRIRRKRNSVAPSAEFNRPTELRSPRVRSANLGQQFYPAPASSRSPAVPFTVPFAVETRATPPSLSTRRSQAPSPLRFEATNYAREARISTGSQFTEHFGDAPANAPRGHTSRTVSALGDKPLPRIPDDSPVPDSPRPSSVRIVQFQGDPPQLELTFTPFDASTAVADLSNQPGGHPRTTTHSLPPGAASPVSSVGGYKPAEQFSSAEVQGRVTGRRRNSEV